jgi:perosamine synthetase
MENELALLGGEKVKKTPFGTGRRFGREELEQLEEALNQNTLFYWKGRKVKQFNDKFAKMYEMPYCVAASSGTASIHTALSAVGVTAGDEVITSPITDMGSVIGILYQNAIPVFADVDPHSYNLDPDSIEEKITDKTKAILVVHLAGNAADIKKIMAIAERHKIKVVEDCAQSYLCSVNGRYVGTFGDVGCFSLNDFKHISAGDGGMLLTKDEQMYRKALRFADKNYDRLAKDSESMRQVEYLAPNYRMTELQGAVGIAQLDRLEGICSARRKYGDMITEGIKNLPGIYPPAIAPGVVSSYWFYMFRIDAGEAGTDRDAFSKALAAEGIPNQPGYIPTCVYEYDMFRTKNVFPGSDVPFSIRHNPDDIQYYKGMCPVAEEVLNTAVRVELSEFYNEQDVRDIIAAINKVSNYYNTVKGRKV